MRTCKNVYDPAQFEYRVSYAAAQIMRANGQVPQGRCFNTCFEMGDGDYVIEALIRRAARNPKLAAVLYRAFNKNAVESIHEQLKDIPRRQLRTKGAN